MMTMTVKKAAFIGTLVVSLITIGTAVYAKHQQKTCVEQMQEQAVKMHQQHIQGAPYVACMGGKN
jgi:hypothetical protein